ncbi:MAG: HEAT repeat domain-containing protein [Planctomycetota bacterium]
MKSSPFAIFLPLLAVLPPLWVSTPEASITWETDFDAAFATAVERDTIVFLAVNMDGERANDTAAKKLYVDRKILPLFAQSVNLVASRFEHSTGDACPRFEGVSCAEHQKVDIKARSQVLKPGPTGDVIAPHHVFLDKHGTVLLSVPYEISARELEWCFATAMNKAYPEMGFPEPKGARAPRRLVMDGVVDGESAGIRPLSEEELEITLKRIRATKSFRDRATDVFSLIATDHPDAIEAVSRDLNTAGLGEAWRGRGGGAFGGGEGGGGEEEGGTDRITEARISLIHRIGVYSPPSYWVAIVPQLESEKVILRHETAVALEQLAAKDAIKAIKAALKDEEDENVRRCLMRAFGTSGPEDATARKELSKAAKSKKEPVVRLNALFGLSGQLDAKKVEKQLQKVLKDGPADQRQAVILGIAFARNSALEPLLAAMEEAPDGLDPATVSAMEAARKVLDGENLATLKAQIASLLGDTIERERFFGGL